MDVDRFKAINDSYGHDIGDSVIVQLGHFLGESFTGNEITGRFGGDEFILFIRDTDDLDTARAIAGELVDGVAEHVALPGQAQRVSVSIGIAAYHGQEKNYSEIFKKADTAMYQAKADAEKRYCVYE